MIRKIEKADVIPCIEIVRANWGKAVSLRFEEEVKHAFKPDLLWPPEYFVFEQNAKVVAFAGMMPSWIMHDVWDFIWINVKPAYQGRGIGAKLTEYRLEQILQRKGAVVNLMTKHPKFFHKFGFHTAHEYIGGWVLMTFQIKELVI